MDLTRIYTKDQRELVSDESYEEFHKLWERARKNKTDLVFTSYSYNFATGENELKKTTLAVDYVVFFKETSRIN